MRFLHAADIHLDSPLRGLGAYPDAPAAQLRGATREAFRRLVTLAIDERVDFVVIAGDLYDGDWPDFNTGLFFCAEMGRLQRAGIPAFVLFGNHDAESQMTRALRLPDNVRCFSAAACEVHRIDALKVALHGRSFKVRDTTDNLVRGYTEPLRGWFNIGVLHTALQGGLGDHAAYAPCTLDELMARGYDYWALGHVHEHKLWTGPGGGAATTVCFPGNLQGRSIRETGRRGAVMVTVDGDGGPPRVERVFFDVLRWEHLAVDVSGCRSLAAAGLAAGRRLAALLDSDAQVPRAVRVSLHGESPAHGELFQHAPALRAQVLAEIAAIAPDRLWLEKVVLATRPPAGTPAAGAALGGDALAELAALLAEACDDEALLAELRDDFAQMAGKAPELLHELPELRAARDGALAPLLDEVAQGLLARLAAPG